MRFDLRHGDSRGVLAALADASVDALVTDPPAGISFMGKSWDHDHGGREGWTEIMASIFEECLRVLKPGAHGLVWALPRTSHWTATALEDAGFEIRDRVSHLFGTGFPKSLDVSKAIDRAAGAEREVVGENPNFRRMQDSAPAYNLQRNPDLTAAATPLAQQWEGWGTALKPACEDWWLVRKPLDGTVAANVAAHGTGALNIDGCRVGFASEADERESKEKNRHGDFGSGRGAIWNTAAPRGAGGNYAPSGRWPANVTLDEEAAALLDEQSGESASTASTLPRGKRPRGMGETGERNGDPMPNGPTYSDTGGASRFFYVAKPDRAERDIGCEELAPATGGEATARVDGTAGLQNPRAGAGRNGGARNIHPTVKSVDLMRWLCRLITPKGGLVLDPFMGSGSTGVACSREGLRFIGIERERQYFEIAKRRLAGDAPLFNSAVLK
jgi:hypothetical protein